MSSRTKKFLWAFAALVIACVLALGFFSFAGCGGKSDDDVPEADVGGDDGGTTGGDEGTPGGTTGGDEGGTTGGDGGTVADEGTLAFKGIYFMSYNADITFNEDGTGTFLTATPEGSVYDSFSGDIEWSYDTDAQNSITGVCKFLGDATFQFSLSYVDGVAVSGRLYIAEINADCVIYRQGVIAALQSTAGSLYTVLYDGGSAVIDSDGAISETAWSFASDGTNVTVGSSTSTSATLDGNGYVVAAEFSDFEGEGAVSFLPINDPSLVGDALYAFENADGYTLSLYDGGVFETTVGDLRFSGDYSERNGNLSLQNGLNDEEVYTGSITYAADGTTITSVTFAEYFAGTTNVTFEINEDETANSFYQQYLKDSNGIDAVAVLHGTKEGDSATYWMFMYIDGTFVAHIHANYVFGSSDGVWQWIIGDDGELELQFLKNGTSEMNSYVENGTLTVEVTNYANTVYTYTIDVNEIPVAILQGTNGTDDTTYYTCLYADGTFKAHIPAQFTSDGWWEKDGNGVKLVKKSTNWATGEVSYPECEQGTDADGNTYVIITNASGTAFTYYFDIDYIPMGGYDISSLS